MEYKGTKKRTFKNSVKDCLDGINFVLSNEKNFVREIIMGMIALTLCVFLEVSPYEYITVLLLICFVLIMELINTALEKVVDLYTTQYNELAKIIKNVSAASVLIMCTFSAIIGIIIFLPKILNIIR